ncbi:MAG: DUF421 domain-containing protein [Clostridia bacterium]|nr:DUF421 domain-containing protein [Clostridia bacterium]
MLTVLIRSIITYFLLLVIMRLMGKRQLSELQPFEFAITLIIAELACIPMAETQIPLMYGVIPIFTLFIVHLFITKIESKSLKFNKFLNGKPIVVMTPEGIDKRLLDKLDMSITDLLHALRSAGYFYPSQIAYAIIETNGKLSVLPKSEYSPVTPDLENMKREETSLPYPVICEGIFEHTNMERAGVEKEQVMTLLEKQKINVKDVLLLSVNGNEVFLQPKKGKALSLTLKDKEI